MFEDQQLVLDELQDALSAIDNLMDGAQLEPDFDEDGRPEQSPQELEAALWIDLVTTVALGQRLADHLGNSSPKEHHQNLARGWHLISANPKAVQVAMLHTDPDEVLESLDRALYDSETSWSELSDLLDDLDRAIAMLWAAGETDSAAELDQQAEKCLALHKVALTPLASLFRRQLDRHGEAGPGACVWKAALASVEGRIEVEYDPIEVPKDMPVPHWLQPLLDAALQPNKPSK